MTHQTIFDLGQHQHKGYEPPKCDVESKAEWPEQLSRSQAAQWPNVSELEAVRHYTKLSQKNFAIDTHFYPLGSCTMKYNPKFTEELSRISGFKDLHPLLPQFKDGENSVQGALKLLHDFEAVLCEITGMYQFTMQPLAGAHGELTGVMMMAAYHKQKKNNKKNIIVPDSAHGTNPATASIAGFQPVSIPTNDQGVMDLEVLKEHINADTAGLMITCPNTYGLFNSDVAQISKWIHDVDGLMYYDGANLNAILGQCRPGDLGFDVMHLNTHKTFTTPHGGGGPGAGPVGVSEKLEPFLPISRIINQDGRYQLRYEYPDSIGYIAPFYGNFGLLVRAFAYIMMLGRQGLIDTSRYAVLNANYLREQLKDVLNVPFDRQCLHECVFSASDFAKDGIHAIDIAKFLIDEGFHPPTVYFPITVKESIMIEPTETESKPTLDAFVAAMNKAKKLSKTEPKRFHDAPTTTPIARPDEVKAARELDTNHFISLTGL